MIHLLTVFYLSLKFDSICLALFELFVRDKRITYECDLNLGRGNLSFKLDTPSHYDLLLFDI